MPEYLAPAVYVEEVDTGSKPIEGVSTSTAGMIGVTERGPLDVPVLVTGVAEYQRTFGQLLNAETFGSHRYLPHAVEGFFTNGGKRLFVTRVLDRLGAEAAWRTLVANVPGMLEARLLLPAGPGATTVVIDADPGLANGDTVQVGEGLAAEFPQVSAAPAAASVLALSAALSFDHAGGETVTRFADHLVGPGEVHDDALAIAADAAGGDITVADATVFVPPLAAGDLLRVGAAGADDEEVVELSGPAAGDVLPLTRPLALAHAAGAVVNRLSAQGAASTIAAGLTLPAGALLVPVTASAGLTTSGDLLQIGSANPLLVEYRRVGAFQRVTLDQPAYASYAAGTRLEPVTAGAVVLATVLTRAAAAGDAVIAVDSRVGVAVGQVVSIGAGSELEIVEVAAVPARLPNPDAGNIVLRAPLRVAHAAASAASFAAAPADPVAVASVITDADAGDTDLAASRSIGAGTLLRVVPASGGPYFHTVTAPSVATTPRTLTLSTPLGGGHLAGTTVAEREPMFDVVAIDPGAWGNRLRVAMEPQDTPLLTTTVRQLLPGGRLRLTSASGVETGTELVVTDSLGATTAVKVQGIDRQDDFLIMLEASTPLPGGAAAGDGVTSREYRFVVELLRQPDPANPARNSMAIDREVFSSLSLDARHSRYFETIIGCTWDTTSAATTEDDRQRRLRRVDRRSEGESQYVRVFDFGFAASAGLRPQPVTAYTTPAGGAPKLVLLPLGHGNDSIATLSDQSYLGADSVNPEERTGLHTLRNIEDISIVAAPGRTEPIVQMALITHCELMRYRFAVLDGPPPPSDSIPDVQAHRQQFDTKYAALYHPWLLIGDPFPATASARQDYPVPPAGHMVGIYARTDIERGVHKSPANEVVRGVVGLQRVLNKEQHDLLNPYPVNVNVIRDFRTNNRGIRVYGGRCITSDSDWKYVNVRRLLIFIEASVDRGLQWVVFEPNAEPLWARVRRAISNFLTIVWRNGGLEGTKVDEAFFVKCDRTTMTQTDIDQGRLICVVGVAPVKPAEFVIVRIGLWTAHAEE